MILFHLPKRAGLAGIYALAALCAGAAPALAVPATTYDGVLAALQSGKEVTVLTDLSRCTAEGTDKAGPPVEGGLVIHAFMVVPGRGIMFEDVHPMLNPSGKPVTEYITYDLAPDGTLSLAVARATAAGVVNRPTMVCKLPTGARFVW
jgi:hypothetical protein